MGSYSDSDFGLPFLTPGDISAARSINQAMADALRKKFKRGYKGVLYGGFIITAQGVRLIEYNARFGDPEAMNVLAILQTDFVDICTAVIDGNLDEVAPEFEPIATVCKYVVPEGYPDAPVKEVKIDISGVDQSKVDIFYAAVDQRQDGLYLTGSRAVALVGKHPDIYEAEKLVEGEIQKIKGPVFHRLDIGTKNLIEKRIKMMEKIKKEGVYEKN
jgi:phosphoribosylamine--glycine ligase